VERCWCRKSAINQSGRRCCMWDRALVLKKARPCIDELTSTTARSTTSFTLSQIFSLPLPRGMHPTTCSLSSSVPWAGGWMGAPSLGPIGQQHSKNHQRLVMQRSKTAAHTSCQVYGALVACRRQLAACCCTYSCALMDMPNRRHLTRQSPLSARAPISSIPG
jgi:hypothetical protein